MYVYTVVQHLTNSSIGAWVCVVHMVHHTQKTDYAQDVILANAARFISPPEPGKLRIICMLMCAA